jgi:NifU-like protein involved in Fe-S cluster formation
MAASSKPVVQAHVYTDGTYSAQGAYRSPAGGELVNVSLTLKGDVVTDATFAGTGTNPKTKMMQAAFASGFKTQVVGKSLDQVSVGVVNGSSLTGIGFMDAVARIKAEAKS